MNHLAFHWVSVRAVSVCCPGSCVIQVPRKVPDYEDQGSVSENGFCVNSEYVEPELRETEQHDRTWSRRVQKPR